MRTKVRAKKQELDVNASIYTTAVMLGHKLREKEIVLKKDLATDLPLLHTECSGAEPDMDQPAGQRYRRGAAGGHIKIRTVMENATYHR